MGNNQHHCDTVTLKKNVPTNFRFRNFPNERQLWEEVQNVLEALQTDSSDQRQTFLTGETSSG